VLFSKLRMYEESNLDEGGMQGLFYDSRDVLVKTSKAW